MPFMFIGLYPDYRSGGHGVDPHAEHPHAAAKDLFDVAPQYVAGVPQDEQQRVSAGTYVKFGTYYYGSHCYLARMRVEAAASGGLAFEDVYLGADIAAKLGKDGGYQPGYTGRVYRTDGHKVVFNFLRNSGWLPGGTVYVRFTGMDGYGREAQKTTLVTWDD